MAKQPSDSDISTETAASSERLHIFVNRRKFDEGDGVRHRMAGRDIARLVDVPPENAVVRLDSGDKREIGIDEEISVKNGQHFLVTRRVVEAGNVTRAN